MTDNKHYIIKGPKTIVITYVKQDDALSLIIKIPEGQTAHINVENDTLIISGCDNGELYGLIPLSKVICLEVQSKE